MVKWILVLVLWDMSGASPSVYVFPVDDQEGCARQHSQVAAELKGISKVTAECYGPVLLEEIYERPKEKAQD